jgi:hypothetical protein
MNRLSESLEVVLNELRLRLYKANRAENTDEVDRLFALHESLDVELKEPENST